MELMMGVWMSEVVWLCCCEDSLDAVGWSLFCL